MARRPAAKKNFLATKNTEDTENLFWILEFGFWICFEFRISNFEFIVFVVKNLLGVPGGLAVQWSLLRMHQKSLQAEKK
jgi:hypothetical protein